MTEKQIRTPYGHMPLSSEDYEGVFRCAEEAFMSSQDRVPKSRDEILLRQDSHTLWTALLQIVAHYTIVLEQTHLSLSGAIADEMAPGSSIVTDRIGAPAPAFSGEFGDGGDQ